MSRDNLSVLILVSLHKERLYGVPKLVSALMGDNIHDVCVPLVDASHDTGGRPEWELCSQHHLQQEEIGLLQLRIRGCIALTQSVQLITCHSPDLYDPGRIKRGEED